MAGRFLLSTGVIRADRGARNSQGRFFLLLYDMARDCHNGRRYCFEQGPSGSPRLKPKKGVVER